MPSVSIIPIFSMHLAAVAYNLKKLLKYQTKKVKSKAETLVFMILKIGIPKNEKSAVCKPPIFLVKT